ncbi:MAG: hypothetical protein IPM34_09840 [Saprospiraceae bacterium]|nr:hypothetical protein [Saprospiraceae bacterium]
MIDGRLTYMDISSLVGRAKANGTKAFLSGFTPVIYSSAWRLYVKNLSGNSFAE